MAQINGFEPDRLINPGVEAGTEEMVIKIGLIWSDLLPWQRNEFRVAFNSGLDAAMKTGALELRTRGVNQAPVPERINRWLEECVAHCRMLELNEHALSRKQLFKIVKQFGEGAEKALEQSK